MENLQSKRLRLASLAFVVAAVGTACAAFPKSAPITIPAVQSGKAVLSQSGRETTLIFTPTSRKPQQIALQHESDYQQGYNGPIKAKLIAESAGQYLVFTDTFASNPGNPQGECGASPSGERFVHVVSLKNAKEMFSTIIESCRQDIESKSTTPEWDPVKHTLSVRFTSYQGHAPRDMYKVADDGSVMQVKVTE